MDNKKLYHNAMEDLVEQEYERNKSKLGCCPCNRCRNDIIAYALNKLPTKYVVSHEGELYSKVDTVVHVQLETDIFRLLAQGAKLIGEHPRHTESDTQND